MQEQGDVMIVALSDIHLGYYCSDEGLFKKFLTDLAKQKEVEHLVLVGDILDMWRRDPTKLLIDYADVFEMLQHLQTGKREVHYVVGNHDYHATGLRDNLKKKYDLDVSLDTTLSCGNTEYYFIHGYQFEYADELGFYQEFADLLCMKNDRIGAEADELWRLFQMLSPFWKRWGTRMGLHKELKRALKYPGERLTDRVSDRISGTIKQWREEYKDQVGDKFIVYGHTHRPFVDADHKKANTGSWMDDPCHPMYRQNTYIVIEEGKVPVLKEYPSPM